MRWGSALVKYPRAASTLCAGGVAQTPPSEIDMAILRSNHECSYLAHESTRIGVIGRPGEIVDHSDQT